MCSPRCPRLVIRGTNSNHILSGWPHRLPFTIKGKGPHHVGMSRIAAYKSPLSARHIAHPSVNHVPAEKPS